MVFLKVAYWKRVARFQKRGKLNPWYINPFRILEKIRPIAYRLELPRDLERIHNVFHVPILRNKVILTVKVLWRSDRVEKMTWETETSMRS